MVSEERSALSTIRGTAVSWISVVSRLRTQASSSDLAKRTVFFQYSARTHFPPVCHCFSSPALGCVHVRSRARVYSIRRGRSTDLRRCWQVRTLRDFCHADCQTDPGLDARKTLRIRWLCSVCQAGVFCPCLGAVEFDITDPHGNPTQVGKRHASLPFFANYQD